MTQLFASNNKCEKMLNINAPNTPDDLNRRRRSKWLCLPLCINCICI